MKYIILFLFLPFIGFSQGGTWPVKYNDSDPSGAPSASGTRLYINTATNTLFTWEPAPSAQWRKQPKAFDQVSGCAAPAYTPTARQSTFAVNSCDPPELYQYTGAAWDLLNAGTTYTAGTGIDITGGVITNTSPNIVQTLSIAGQDLTLSGGGGTVEIPGVSWPLLAPDGAISAPSYSFTNSDESGLFYDGILNVSSAPSTPIFIKSGDEIVGVSGPGSITITPGAGTDESGAAMFINSGSSTNGQGGKLQFVGGEGVVGASFSMFAGTSTGVGEKGGAVALNGGGANDGIGGDVTILGGAGSAGSGRIALNSWGVEIVAFDLATRALLTDLNPGTVIFCSDATATDSSTGVMQVWNGSAWKNAW